MENKITTAEEFFKEKYGVSDRIATSNATLLAIEFAKLHVEAALKGCLNKYHHASEENYDFGSSEIMNAYPLTNIK